MAKVFDDNFDIARDRITELYRKWLEVKRSYICSINITLYSLCSNDSLPERIPQPSLRNRGVILKVCAFPQQVYIDTRCVYSCMPRVEFNDWTQHDVVLGQTQFFKQVQEITKRLIDQYTRVNEATTMQWAGVVYTARDVIDELLTLYGQQFKLNPLELSTQLMRDQFSMTVQLVNQLMNKTFNKSSRNLSILGNQFKQYFAWIQSGLHAVFGYSVGFTNTMFFDYMTYQIGIFQGVHPVIQENDVYFSVIMNNRVFFRVSLLEYLKFSFRTQVISVAFGHQYSVKNACAFGSVKLQWGYQQQQDVVDSATLMKPVREINHIQRSQLISQLQLNLTAIQIEQQMQMEFPDAYEEALQEYQVEDLIDALPEQTRIDIFGVNDDNAVQNEDDVQNDDFYDPRYMQQIDELLSKTVQRSVYDILGNPMKMQRNKRSRPKIFDRKLDDNIVQKSKPTKRVQSNTLQFKQQLVQLDHIQQALYHEPDTTLKQVLSSKIKLNKRKLKTLRVASFKSQRTGDLEFIQQYPDNINRIFQVVERSFHQQIYDSSCAVAACLTIHDMFVPNVKLPYKLESKTGMFLVNMIHLLKFDFGLDIKVFIDSDIDEWEVIPINRLQLSQYKKQLDALKTQQDLLMYLSFIDTAHLLRMINRSGDSGMIALIAHVNDFPFNRTHIGQLPVPDAGSEDAHVILVIGLDDQWMYCVDVDLAFQPLKYQRSMMDRLFRSGRGMQCIVWVRNPIDLRNVVDQKQFIQVTK